MILFHHASITIIIRSHVSQSRSTDLLSSLVWQNLWQGHHKVPVGFGSLAAHGGSLHSLRWWKWIVLCAQSPKRKWRLWLCVNWYQLPKWCCDFPRWRHCEKVPIWCWIGIPCILQITYFWIMRRHMALMVFDLDSCDELAATSSPTSLLKSSTFQYSECPLATLARKSQLGNWSTPNFASN